MLIVSTTLDKDFQRCDHLSSIQTTERVKRAIDDTGIFVAEKFDEDIGCFWLTYRT